MCFPIFHSQQAIISRMGHALFPGMGLLLGSFAEPLDACDHLQTADPLLLAPELISELRHLDPEVGLKQIREHHEVLELAVDDRGILGDIDTPADYERFRAEASDE